MSLFERGLDQWERADRQIGGGSDRGLFSSGHDPPRDLNPILPYGAGDPYNTGGAPGNQLGAGDYFGYDPNRTGGGQGNQRFIDNLLRYGTAALDAYQRYAAGQDASRNAEAFARAQARQRAETLAFASPATYLQLYNQYQTEFQNAYRPWLVTEQDRAALGEQNLMQGFEADLARRGLSGSGLALAGRSAIRSGRQAQINANLRAYRLAIEEAARGGAQQTQQGLISASTGNPVAFNPSTPGGFRNILSGVQEGLGTYGYVDALQRFGQYRKPPGQQGIYDIGPTPFSQLYPSNYQFPSGYP